MADRMDKLLAALDRQEFTARQTKAGNWLISRDGVTVSQVPPETPGEFIDLIQQLRRIGLVFPEET